MGLFEFISEEYISMEKSKLKNGEDKVIYENENIKITLKKRGRKLFTFIDEFGDESINTVLNKVVNLA